MGPSAGAKVLVRKPPSTLAASWVFHGVSGDPQRYCEGRGLWLAGVGPLPAWLEGLVCLCFVTERGLCGTTVILFAASNCRLNLVKRGLLAGPVCAQITSDGVCSGGQGALG